MTAVLSMSGLWLMGCSASARPHDADNEIPVSHRLAEASVSDGGTADGGATADANPCGDPNLFMLPACTPALEGVSCFYEACVCCQNGGVCTSGNWVPTYNGSDCPVDGGKEADVGTLGDAADAKDAG